jgi:hypothetical protein
MNETPDPVCVEADPSEGGFVWVEATAKTSTGEARLAYWLGDVGMAHDEQRSTRRRSPPLRRADLPLEVDGR